MNIRSRVEEIPHGFCHGCAYNKSQVYFYLSIRKLVQGEDMNKKSGFPKNSHLPVYLIFCIGFIVGIFLPNILWKIQWRQKAAASLYFISTFVNGAKENCGYLQEVFQKRGAYYLLFAFMGCTVFGVPLAALGMALSGAEVGMLFSASILQMGFQGGIFALGLLFPQYLFYLPCTFYLMRMVFEQSTRIWHKKGLLPSKNYPYILRVSVCGILYVAGIFCEIYVNPIVTEVLTKSLEFF